MRRSGSLAFGLRDWTKTIAGLTILAAALYSVPCAASGDGTWTGPGWYQIEDDHYMGKAAVGGPFDTQSACEATLGKSDEEATESCAHFASKDEYDKL